MNPVKPNDKTTLLLNRAWVPINAVTARAAFTHLYKGRVTALDKHSNLFHSQATWEGLAEFHDDQPVLRSAKGVWHVPTIVVVTSTFFRRPKKKRLALYDLVKIYNHTCQYCLKKCDVKDLTVDHIHPRSKGGADDHENRTLACKSCNSRKGSSVPFYNINNEKVYAPTIPNLMMNTTVFREEWKQYLKTI